MLPEPELRALPEALAELGLSRLHALAEAAGGLPGPERLRGGWQRVLALSDFVADSLDRRPELLADLATSGDLEREHSAADYLAALGALLEGGAALDAVLRRFRRREMIRIIYRDLNGLADLEGTCRDLCSLADACIATALDELYQRQVRELGTPIGDESGRPQALVVLALGKLGGLELNLSSDVDLVFFFEEMGEVRPPAGATNGRHYSNQEFFVRLARGLIDCLSRQDAEGFVFRVDMRLRPWGEGGPLAVCRPAMESYYYEQGRDWERYAFLKARFVAGDRAAGMDMLSWLRPFVFRRNLDFGTIESLRQMKSLINQEVRRKGMEHDLKLGPGGIREVEFTAQCHQLIWGGRRPSLREPRLLAALDALQAAEVLDAETAGELVAAYRFLRRSEHCIQAEQDRQTQQLPVTERSRQRLACAMGFDGWDAYLETLDGHRARVTRHIRELLRTNDEQKAELREADAIWGSVWRTIDEPGRAEADAVGTRFGDLPEAARQLRQLHALLHRELIPGETVGLYDRLVPRLLPLIEREADPDLTLRRILPILETVLRRTTWISFLLEHREALTRMVRLCAASGWIAEQLQKQPMLLNELTDRSTHRAAPDRATLAQMLERHMAAVDRTDLERQMDELRHFKNGEQLKVAVLELSNLLPLMKVSDYLSWLAEVLLEYVLALAGEELVGRHGHPERADGSRGRLDFAVIGYGKLGGLELGYGSDLDLVFLYDCLPGGTTDGGRPVANETFYVRLGQRVLHILSSITSAGIIYQTDTRLRPSGGKGSLVSTIGAFAEYQRDRAWTWEHQALVRARPVAGDRTLWERFEEIRRSVLCKPRSLDLLRGEIVGMRRKMREAGLGARREPPAFDLKHAPGAIVDIEFMIQYAILANSASHPEVGHFSDNMRLIDALAACGLLGAPDAEFLQRAYLSFRAANHYEALGGKVEHTSYEELNALRPGVMRLWMQLLGEAVEAVESGH